MKHYTQLIVALLIAITCLTACSKKSEDGACGNGFDNYDFSFLPPLASGGLIAFTGTLPPEGKVGYYYDGNKVTFLLGKSYNNVCNKEHTQISYMVRFSDAAQTESLKVYGDAYYSAFSRKAILFDGTPTPGDGVSDINLEVGLEQAFPNSAGAIDFAVNVEFTTLGNLSLDSAYFVEHIAELSAFGRYSKYGQ